ncbi:nuclear transport factor 2 family protein [Gordonia sp. CPCC 205333]|uniref:nuclear transport factor 2 family protein n=1 Tax=Gordonia sp. CPCC 205333 TaxID=3140790 RepID=UPI003AF3D9D7
MTRSFAASKTLAPRVVLLAITVVGLAALLLACGTDDAVSPTSSHSADDATQANRKLVVDFYDRFFNEHQVDEAASVVADDYRQHNPNVPDGKAPFVSFFKKSFADNPAQRSRIVRSAATDDLVYLHVHATERPDDRGSAIVDIFRVKDGKIVEHWDVIQPVPEKSANNNTMF